MRQHASRKTTTLSSVTESNTIITCEHAPDSHSQHQRSGRESEFPPDLTLTNNLIIPVGGTWGADSITGWQASAVSPETIAAPTSARSSRAQYFLRGMSSGPAETSLAAGTPWRLLVPLSLL